MGSAFALGIEIVRNLPEIINGLNGLFAGRGRGKEKHEVASGEVRRAEAGAGITNTKTLDTVRDALIAAQVAYANAVEKQLAEQEREAAADSQ